MAFLVHFWTKLMKTFSHNFSDRKFEGRRRSLAKTLANSSMSWWPLTLWIQRPCDPIFGAPSGSRTPWLRWPRASIGGWIHRRVKYSDVIIRRNNYVFLLKQRWVDKISRQFSPSWPQITNQFRILCWEWKNQELCDVKKSKRVRWFLKNK